MEPVRCWGGAENICSQWRFRLLPNADIRRPFQGPGLNRYDILSCPGADILPTVYASREYVDSDGLISYAAHYADLYRRAASYVDKIFKGAKPADLPVEQPTKLVIAINLKTANALGIIAPPTLLARTDEMIE
jgi:putative ABC transport system substrate-binding protein